MAYKISMENEGGELDSVVVEKEADLQDALLDMIEGLASVHSGDKFVITEIA